MVVQHNIMALNSHRRLGVNNTAVGKNLEKLSSGYRINRAGDDAAGLAISEKMRAQIKGLEVAQRNAQDGISLVQTAEGALDEVHSMLKRMVELSTQAANGTYDDQSRSELQKEITKLNEEIDRIAEGTNFNDIKLLNGDLGRGNLPKFGGLENITPKLDSAVAKQVGVTLGGTGLDLTALVGKELSAKFSYVDESGKKHEETLTLKVVDGSGGKASLVTANGKSIEVAAKANVKGSELSSAFAAAAAENSKLSSVFNVSNNAADLVVKNNKAGTGSKAEFIDIKIDDIGGNKVTTQNSTNAAVIAKDNAIVYDFKAADGYKPNTVFTVNGQKFAFLAKGQVGKIQFDSDVTVHTMAADTVAADDVKAMAALIAKSTGMDPSKVVSSNTTIAFYAGPDNGGLDLQVGDTGELFNQLKVSVESMDSKSLGVKDIDISSIDGARNAIDKIKNAINQVSSSRSDLGAVQNRLEHTISNLSVAAENMTASESRIRDVDMAKEMMMFTQNNVLSQAAQAMLAQSNQQPQQILQLLR